MLRAVKELNTNYLDVETTNDLYIAGYSQGGWATMQIQKAIEQQFSGEFNLKASACGAGPYDLSFVNKYITEQTTYPMPYFVGYMYNSYFSLGAITTAGNEIFQEPYATKIPALYDGTKSGTAINAELTTTVADLFTSDYLANYETGAKYSSVVNSLSVNSVAAWNATTPILLLHGTSDEFVPPQVSTNIYQEFIAKGVSAEDIILVPLPDLGHTDGIIPAGLASVKWFLDLQNQ
jgi:pimeloyl-ACP methyl ester carboxylesterase